MKGRIISAVFVCVATVFPATAVLAPAAHAATLAPAVDPATFYDGQAAADWAVANEGHAELIRNGDCTWFASQAAWAGGLPQSADWAKYSPDGILGSNDSLAALKAAVYAGYSPTDPVNPTLTATNANDFVNYLVGSGLAEKIPINWSDNTAGGAQLGDFIAYDWDDGSNGTIDHIAVVTGFVPGTNYPLVTQHTPPQTNRYWSWSPTDNSWIQFGRDYQPSSSSGNGPPKAYLIHIIY